jgi:hypothetical protein
MTTATDLKARIVQCVAKPVQHTNSEIGVVYLRRMTLGEMDEMNKANTTKQEPGTEPIPTSVRLLARFLGDEKGQPIFDLNNKDDLLTLKAFPVAVAGDLLKAGNKANGMEQVSAEEAAGKG